MIEIKRLTKAYDKAPVLRDVNLAVPDKSVFGLVGINGAGKSTLLRLISGVLKADNGIILIDGEPVYENEAAKRQIFFLPAFCTSTRSCKATRPGSCFWVM